MKVILTGGAGFIGSCFLQKLNGEGITDVIVVDRLDELKRKNLLGKKYIDYIEKEDFLSLLLDEKIGKVDLFIHLGACTSTMEKNASYLVKNNFIYSKEVAKWAFKNDVRFLYASSAATYGAGENGFGDEDENTRKLKPLNLYGFSKHLFDLRIIGNNFSDKCAGFKFFNVFGPNEYHKGYMRSVVVKSFEEIKTQGKVHLFKSYRDKCPDGEQKRDFVYVKDVVKVMYYFIENPDKNGIFNVGTGKARSFNDLAGALFSALEMERKIEYVDMPESIRENYQYFTQADLRKLRKAGCNHQFMELNEAVADYAGYLKEQKYL